MLKQQDYNSYQHMLAKHIKSVCIPQIHVHAYKIKTTIEAVQWLAAIHNLAI